MPYTVRLTYVSRSTCKPESLIQHLQDIQKQACIANGESNINAILYYGNNYFIQSIEGRKTQVHALFNRICNDTRHTDVVVLAYREVSKLSMIKWRLKCVRHDEQIQRFLHLDHWELFNPYLLHEDRVDDFVELLILKENNSLDEEAICSFKNDKWYARYNLPAIAFFLACLGIVIFYALHVG